MLAAGFKPPAPFIWDDLSASGTAPPPLQQAGQLQQPSAASSCKPEALQPADVTWRRQYIFVAATMPAQVESC